MQALDCDCLALRDSVQSCVICVVSNCLHVLFFRSEWSEGLQVQRAARDLIDVRGSRLCRDRAGNVY